VLTSSCWIQISVWGLVWVRQIELDISVYLCLVEYSTVYSVSSWVIVRTAGPEYGCICPNLKSELSFLFCKHKPLHNLGFVRPSSDLYTYFLNIVC
jgi:hypothetical protein